MDLFDILTGRNRRYPMDEKLPFPSAPSNGGFDLGMLEQILAPILQQAAGQLQQGVTSNILPRTGFIGRHPKFANMLESGLMGAALTRSGDTIGENISNVAAGILGVPQMREQLVHQRRSQALEDLMGPAGMLLKLEDFKLDRQYKQALIDQYTSGSKRDFYEGTERPIPTGGLGAVSRKTGRFEIIPGTEGVNFLKAPADSDREQLEKGLWNEMSEEERAQYGNSFFKYQDAKRLEMAAALSGATTGARYGAIPGFESEAEKRWLDFNERNYRGLLLDASNMGRRMLTFGAIELNFNDVDAVRVKLDAAFKYWRDNDSKNNIPFDLNYFAAFLKAKPRSPIGGIPAPQSGGANPGGANLAPMGLRDLIEQMNRDRMQHQVQPQPFNVPSGSTTQSEQNPLLVPDQNYGPQLPQPRSWLERNYNPQALRTAFEELFVPKKYHTYPR